MSIFKEKNENPKVKEFAGSAILKGFDVSSKFVSSDEIDDYLKLAFEIYPLKTEFEENRRVIKSIIRIMQT